MKSSMIKVPFDSWMNTNEEHLDQTGRVKWKKGVTTQCLEEGEEMSLANME